MKKGTKFFYLLFFIFVVIVYLSVFSKISLGYYLIDGNFEPCTETDGCREPNPGICAKSEPGNCPSCGATSGDCCDRIPAWSKYKASCKLVDEYTCDWVWVYDTQVCSTGDKCIPGETGLRAGDCSCGYGGIYKTCCSGTNPVLCKQYGIQDGTYPPEGVCPAGTTTVRCGGPGQPACGAEACSNSGHPKPTPNPTSTPTPTPTPKPTPTPTLAPPRNVRAQCTQPFGPVNLNWTDSPNEGGYRVAKRVGGGNWNRDYARLSQNTTSYSDTRAIAPGIDYYYQVGACRPNKDVCTDLKWSNTASVACPTPLPWKKSKNIAFVYKEGNFVNPIPTAITPYDSEDTSQRFFVIGENQGIIAVKGTGVNLSSASRYIENYNFSSSYPKLSSVESFITYMKGNKIYTTKLTPSLDGSINPAREALYFVYLKYPEVRPLWIVSSHIKPDPSPRADYVLVVDGSVFIDSSTGNFNVNTSDDTPLKNIIIIAKTIRFSASVNKAYGVFIANEISFDRATTGIKIKGNIVAFRSFSFNREDVSSGNLKPALFLVFDPTPYVKLLKYISTTKTERLEY